MKSLGCNVAMISCVGQDKDGDAIIQGLDTGSITRAEGYPTGLVQAFVNERGSA